MLHRVCVWSFGIIAFAAILWAVVSFFPLSAQTPLSNVPTCSSSEVATITSSGIKCVSITTPITALFKCTPGQILRYTTAGVLRCANNQTTAPTDSGGILGNNPKNLICEDNQVLTATVNGLECENIGNILDALLRCSSGEVLKFNTQGHLRCTGYLATAPSGTTVIGADLPSGSGGVCAAHEALTITRDGIACKNVGLLLEAALSSCTASSTVAVGYTTRRGLLSCIATRESCTASTGTNTEACVLQTTPHGGVSVGVCSGNNVGACSYSCNDGSWTKTSNTCRAGRSCTGSTINACDVGDKAHNGTSGSCTTNYQGGCQYRCNDGSWVQVSNNCSRIPINGGWTEWSPSASTVCDPTKSPDPSAATSVRQTRSCTNPAPAHGGANCAGPLFQTVPGTKDCNCEYSAWRWSVWTPAATSYCSGKEFTQNRTGTRTRISGSVATCTDTSTQESRKEIGTKNCTCGSRNFSWTVGGNSCSGTAPITAADTTGTARDSTGTTEGTANYRCTKGQTTATWDTTPTSTSCRETPCRYGSWSAWSRSESSYCSGFTFTKYRTRARISGSASACTTTRETVYTQGTKSCTCAASTVSDCVRQAGSVGSSSGSCRAGYNGSCSYTCSPNASGTAAVWTGTSTCTSPTPTQKCNYANPQWTVGSNTCSLPLYIGWDVGTSKTVTDSSGSTTGSATVTCVANPGSSFGTISITNKRCTRESTPVNGGWTSWSPSTSTRCSGTSFTQTRSCTNPSPRNGGSNCSGSSSRTVTGTKSCPTTPGKCPATTEENCVLTETSADSFKNGRCELGYSGSCRYLCGSSVKWFKSTNTCMSPINQDCRAEAKSIPTGGNCSLPATNHGRTGTGTCPTGQTGSCSAYCSNGSFGTVRSSCGVSRCLSTDISNCRLITTNEGTTRSGRCVNGTSGSCSYRCSDDGTWTPRTNSCKLPRQKCNGAGVTWSVSSATCRSTQHINWDVGTSKTVRDNGIPLSNGYNAGSIGSATVTCVANPGSTYGRISITNKRCIGVCSPTTIAGCSLPLPASYGNDGIGTCGAGYQSGSCRYKCVNGRFTLGSASYYKACKRPGCTSTTKFIHTTSCSLPAANNGATGRGTCPTGYTGSCSAVCSNGSYSLVGASNSCRRSICPSGKTYVTTGTCSKTNLCGGHKGRTPSCTPQPGSSCRFDWSDQYRAIVSFGCRTKTATCYGWCVGPGDCIYGKAVRANGSTFSIRKCRFVGKGGTKVCSTTRYRCSNGSVSRA